MPKEIPIYEIEHVKIGNAQSARPKPDAPSSFAPRALPPESMCGARFAASRESELLNPVAA